MEENIIEQPNLEPDLDTRESAENQDGSIFGKFKDAKSLLDAYNSLQAEFTRKSQKLADIQKELDKSAVFQNSDSLDNVLNSSTDNDKYKKEITEILSNDSDINNLPNKNLVAFKIIKEAERRSAENLNNQEFIDKYILNNKNITNQILSKYLSDLNNISTAPKTISGNSQNVFFTPSETPKTLKEAGDIFSKMLK